MATTGSRVDTVYSFDITSVTEKKDFSSKEYRFAMLSVRDYLRISLQLTDAHDAKNHLVSFRCLTSYK